MSILIKRIDTNNSGGSSKGYPPGNVTNVDIVDDGGGTVLIQFYDPDDIIIGDKTLSTWYSTIIVRKEGSAPTSIKDGDIVLTNTTRKYYEDGYFVDSNVTVGKTYYYRFYTMSTNKIYNDSTNMIYSIKVSGYDSVLKNNTWKQIAKASESGVASSIWKVGDEIDITLSGKKFNETVTLQIWDFNHFDRTDGGVNYNSKAGIVFGMKNLMKNTQQMNTSDTNSGGWNDTYMKKTVMTNILSSMPSDLQNVIKEVKTYANEGSYNTADSIGLLSNDKVFLPGFVELFGTSSSNYNTESNQKQFPIFTDDNSRIKKNNSGYGDWYWLRSPVANHSTHFHAVGGYGSKNGTYQASASIGICFCFCV